MTNIAAIATNYRNIGDVPFAVIEPMLRDAKSPMLATARDTHDVASPHSALFWAQAWLENQWETTGHIIRPQHHNPVSLRPEVHGQTGPYAVGLITASDGGQFLTFKTDSDCVKEWKRRLFDDPGYKGGIYDRTQTLAQMLAVYAPSGDVHPVTGLDNADIQYLESVTTKLKRFADNEKVMTDKDGVVDTLKDILTDVVEGQGKGDKPADGSGSGSQAFAPPVVLTYLKDPDPQLITIVQGRDVFFPVDADCVAIRRTSRYQKAVKGGPKRGEDMMPGDLAHIDFAWIDYRGDLWLYSEWDTRFFGADFLRVDGSPIPVPDPSPDKTDDLNNTPPPTTIITAQNYRQVADPASLLPPIEWVGSPNFFPNRSGFGKPIAIVNHITDDMKLNNVLGWLSDSRSQASSHFVIDRDGKVYQLVSSNDGAWTNGDYMVNGVMGYRLDIPWIGDLVRRGININNATITIEHVGTPSNPPTEAQYRSSIAIHRYFGHPKVYGISPNRSHRNRHADVNRITRLYCPGGDFDQERIIVECGGDPLELVA